MSEQPINTWGETWEELGNRHSPWWLYVCDKDGVPIEVIKDPQSVTFTARHSAVPTGTVTLPAGHERVADLVRDGARYFLRSALQSSVISTGTIRGEQGSSAPGVGGAPAPTGSGTWNLVDDRSLLGETLGAPAAGKAYDTIRGPAETVARTLIGRAMTRLGIPHSLWTSRRRGDTITVNARWHPLSDLLYPAVTQAGIGLRVRWSHQEQQYQFSAYEPKTWPLPLTPESGLVSSWEWSRTYPAATRAVVLGPGEGVARRVRTVTNASLESALATIREVVVDARDIGDVDPDEGRTLAMVHAEMDNRGWQTLTEAARVTGLKVDLSAVPEMAFGRPSGLDLGDRVTVQLVPGAEPLQESITEVHMSWATGSGFTVEPRIGEWSESPTSTLSKHIAKLAASVRAQKVS